MKDIFLNLICSVIRIIVYIFFTIMFLAVLGKYTFINLVIIIILAILLVIDIINIKKYLFDKNKLNVDSELGIITISDYLITQLIEKVVTNIDNITIEKIDVFIKDNIVNVDLILNVAANISFYGAAHNIELAVKREMKDLLGYDKSIKFIFNIDRLIK